jgi:hypothetical protein
MRKIIQEWVGATGEVLKHFCWNLLPEAMSRDLWTRTLHERYAALNYQQTSDGRKLGICRLYCDCN